MSARRRSPGGGRLKAVFWFNVVVLAGLGGWFAVQPAARREEVGKLVENYFNQHKRIDLIDVVRDIHELYYSADFVASAPPGNRAQVYGGAPRAAGFSHAIRVLENKGYLVGYCDALEDPVWVAYHVRDIAQLEPPAPRPERFETDLRTAARVPSSAYANSGYDRGHLAPNYAIATRYGEAAQRETFLMSNVVPQRHALNAGLWKEMEMKIASSYPGRFGEVWVVAGPVFDARAARLTNGTVIPAGFFMIVVDESDRRIRTEAFLFPQETKDSAGLEDFLVSIDEIEKRTGLDFLPELEASVQTALEAKRARAVW